MYQAARDDFPATSQFTKSQVLDLLRTRSRLPGDQLKGVVEQAAISTNCEGRKDMQSLHKKFEEAVSKLCAHSKLAWPLADTLRELLLFVDARDHLATAWAHLDATGQRLGNLNWKALCERTCTDQGSTVLSSEAGPLELISHALSWSVTALRQADTLASPVAMGKACVHLMQVCDDIQEAQHWFRLSLVADEDRDSYALVGVPAREHERRRNRATELRAELVKLEASLPSASAVPGRGPDWTVY